VTDSENAKKIQDLFETLQNEALPGVWSKGVAWSRTPSNFIVDDWKLNSEEWRFRVVLPSATVHPRVTLWPLDQEWHCNCDDRNDPCPHTIAVVACIRNGILSRSSSNGSVLGAPGTPSPQSTQSRASNPEQAHKSTPSPVLKRNHTVVRYLWKVHPKTQELHLTRDLLLPNGSRKTLVTSLVSVVGAHQTGRSDTPPIAASKEDFKVDQLLSRASAASFETARGMPSRFSPQLVHQLLALLSEFGHESVEIQTQDESSIISILCSSSSRAMTGKIENASENSFRFAWTSEDGGKALTFRNGALLTPWYPTQSTKPKDHSPPVLRPWINPLSDQSLPSELRKIFHEANGRPIEIKQHELEAWVTRYLPALTKRISLLSIPGNFPKLDQKSEPRIEFHVEHLQSMTADHAPEVSLTPRVVYWNGEIQSITAEWDFQKLKPSRQDLIPERKVDRELELSRILFTDYQLKIGVPVRIPRARAAQILDKFRSQSQSWMLPAEAVRTSQFSRSSSHSLSIASKKPLQVGLNWSPLTGSTLPTNATPSPNFSLHPNSGKINLELTFSGASEEQNSIHASAEEVWNAWNRGESLVPLIEGGFAPIPEDWLRRNRSWLEKFFINRETSRFEAKTQQSWLKLPEILYQSSVQNEESPRQWLQSLKEKLQAQNSWLEFTPNSSPSAVLRSYQRDGVDWLLTLRSLGAGALLADDMGLGKTLQCLSAIPERTLIVCPTSVLYSWKKQIQQFFPEKRIHLHHGANRFKTLEWKLSHWVLTTYGVLRSDAEQLRQYSLWNAIVLDEAQNIKNPESLTSQVIYNFSKEIPWRLALSGTPIENRIEELWSLSQFINPGLLGTLREFTAEAREDFPSARRKVRPFLLRRLKQEVAKELPPRIEETLECELNSAEREVYSRVLHSKEVDQLGTIQILEQLLRLRQSCADPALLPAEWTQGVTLGDGVFSESSKTQLLMEQLESSIESGHRSLIFSQWTSYLDRITNALERRKIPHLRIDGSTQNRSTIIETFQQENGPPVLLLSLKAGGVGLTLTAADHVYILDPWWNPATEDQAADRAHRIGQTRSVLIRRIIAKDSVEEKILELQTAKRELAAALFAREDEPSDAAKPPSSSSELTRQELLALFQD